MPVVVSAYDYHKVVRNWKEMRGFIPEITTMENLLAVWGRGGYNGKFS